MNIKNNKKSKQSEQAFQLSLYELLKTTQFKDITISQLCKHANLNRTTFYAHYDKIEDIILNICETHIAKMYNIFLDTNQPYIERVYKSLLIIKENLQFYSYVFTHVHNLELKVIEMIESSLFSKVEPENYEKSKLSLAFIISGFLGIGKTYFYDLKENKTNPIPSKEFAELITSVINKDNPYFTIN